MRRAFRALIAVQSSLNESTAAVTLDFDCRASVGIVQASIH